MMTGARIPRAHLPHQFEPVHAPEPVVDDEAIDLGKVWRLQDIARFGIGADLVTFGFERKFSLNCVRQHRSRGRESWEFAWGAVAWSRPIGDASTR